MNDRALTSTRFRPRLLAGLTALASTFLPRQHTAAADVPDIIVMLLNDARDGDQIALPQTMARLRDGGTTFPNFFLTTPLCCPSRATVLTGLYSHNTVVYENSDGNHGGWSGFAKRGNRGRTTGVLLQNAGYRTAAIGGYLNGDQPGRGLEPGWDVGPNGKGRKKNKHGKKKGKKGKHKHKNKKRGRRQALGYADAAIAELVNAPADRPLYMHIGFGPPHVPVNPVPPYAGQFAGVQVDRADLSFNEADMADKPLYLRKRGRLSSGDEAWLDSLHQRRLECLLQLDDDIARVWDALVERGKLDNTYVFFFTDNGYLLGQHRHYGKHVPYDGSVRMPLYAFGPGFNAGAIDERLVGNIDVAPTLAEIAGIPPPDMDGVSLFAAHERDAILLEFLAPDVNTMKWPGPRTEISRYSALRTTTHLYVENRSGERELYDYVTGPYETENLLHGTPTPETVSLAATLASRLDELRNCRGGACL